MILFVDDEARRTEAYRESCELAGLRVSFIDDAERVVEAVRERRPELRVVVLDVMMPMGARYNRPEATFGTRTGLEVYKELRAAHPTLPIFLFTQSHDREVDVSIEGDGMARVARKQDVLPSDFPGVIQGFLSEVER